MKNSTHIFVFNTEQTKNGLEQKIRRNFSEAAMCSLKYDYFRQNCNKTHEKLETDENFCEEKNLDSQPNNLNPSKDKFRSNSLIELIMKINGGITSPDKLVISQMLLPIAVLKGLSGSRESAVSALSSKMLSPEFKKKCIYNIDKKFTHIFENYQEQKFRSMSSNNMKSDLAFLKNEIVLPNKYDKSTDSVILNVTVNIPLSDLNTDNKSNDKLSCSAKIDEIINLSPNNQSTEKDLSTYKNSITPIQIENYGQGDFSKGRRSKLYSLDKKLHDDGRSATEVPYEEFHSKPVKKKSKLETTINAFEARIRHEKVKNINKHVKMLTQNLQSSHDAMNQMIKGKRKEEQNKEQNNKSNIQMSHETIKLDDEKDKNTREQTKMLTQNSRLSPNKINRTVEREEKNKKSNIRMFHETGLESYPNWLGRKRTYVNKADEQIVEKNKYEQSLACPGEKEKAIYLKKHLNNLEEPEYYDSVTSKPLKDKEQLTIKSAFNKNRVLDDSERFERMTDDDVFDKKYKGKSFKNELLYDRSVKYCPRMASEELKYRSNEKVSKKYGRDKIENSSEKRFLDWRDQCSDINEPPNELSYSLSDFKSRSDSYVSSININRNKINSERNEMEKEYERKRGETKESEKLNKNQLKQSQIHTKPFGEAARNISENNKSYQQKKNSSVQGNKTDDNYVEENTKKKCCLNENKQAKTEVPQNNKRLSDHTSENKIKEENKTTYKKNRTIKQSRENYKQFKKELTKMKKSENKIKQKNINYPMRNTTSKETTLFELTETEHGKCLPCTQNKSLEFSVAANSLKNKQDSKIQLSREEQIAIKTAEFCKILLELVKLFSISAMKDIERSNNQNKK